MTTQDQHPTQYPPASEPSYGQPQYQQPPAAARGTNTMAIMALVCALVFWPLAIVFGHIARREIRRTGEDGSVLATAGLVIGYLWLVVMGGAVVVGIIAGLTGG